MGNKKFQKLSGFISKLTRAAKKGVKEDKNLKKQGQNAFSRLNEMPQMAKPS